MIFLRLMISATTCLAFVVAGPVSGHHGGWRYPTADRNLLSLDYYSNIGKILEDGRFDLIFFADILAILVIGIVIELCLFAPLERRVLRRRGLLAGSL